MCVQATRFSKTLKMQLSIPMAISGILVVVAPLFGTMQTQIFVKMFSLVMQLICFQFLISMTPTAGMGNEMPKIYSFYEVTFVVTFISLLATVILKALSRNERIIPPAHNLYLLARTFNTYVCCSNQKNENQVWKIENLSSSKDQNGGVSVDQESNQWLEMFVAVNNAISLLLVVIYVIAALTLNL
uniref:Neurotransmitter-gated ion-channel transmembrane domain-containing protein n=1 Tax=Romanomermis culicivorax TaxID=13658 RepID=A0A915J9N4_ROMCU